MDIHMDTYAYIIWIHMGPRSQALAQNWRQAQMGQGPRGPGPGPGSLGLCRQLRARDWLLGPIHVCIHVMYSYVFMCIRM